MALSRSARTWLVTVGFVAVFVVFFQSVFRTAGIIRFGPPPLIDLSFAIPRASREALRRAAQDDSTGTRLVQLGPTRDEITTPLPAGGDRPVMVQLVDGRITLHTAPGRMMRWTCERGTGLGNLEVRENDGRWLLDATRTGGLHCDAEVPSGAYVSVEGLRVGLDVERPRFDLRARLADGDVAVALDTAVATRVGVTNPQGTSDRFPATADTAAVQLHFVLESGRVRNVTSAGP